MAGAGVALAGMVIGLAAAGAVGTSAGAGAGRTATPRSRSAASQPANQTQIQTQIHGQAQAHNQGQNPNQAKAATHAASTGLRTSCQSVAHIGDSTSVDLISPAFLPNKAQRLSARYASVGVRHPRIDASGGRSIVEALPGQVNGYRVASTWRSQGYHGCWVFALGTNDAANVAVGSHVGMMARIDKMMAVAHGQPVMWVNTRTLLTSGPWASANARLWDKALVRALHRYPNMRIFNWSAVAQPGWFLPDGIHYNSLGCAMRASAIADALARAFPLNGHSKGQIVG